MPLPLPNCGRASLACYGSSRNRCPIGATKENDTIARKPRRPAAVTRLLKLVEQSLDDDKAEDIVTIDLYGKTSITDYMVIASGRSQRQVGSIADHLVERLKTETPGIIIRVEGKPQNDWVLVDAGDVVVHIFRPEVRGFYRLEKMWSTELPEQAAAGA
jgi:ribosome-associated protein